MSDQKPIRLALIGAGIFTRDARIPAYRKLAEQFEIVAVCSRTAESAMSAASLLEKPVDIYTDAAELLRRDDIEAVDVVLPIETMPDMVEAALGAGKHVVSEKPVSPTVEVGKRLLGKQTDRVWMVSENFRYEEALLEAAAIVQSGEIGRPFHFHWDIYIDMTPANPYYHTTWRRTGTFQGGYILDGGVHVAAGMRLIFGEVARVSAFTAQVRPDLPPADTMSSVLQFESGVLGAWNISYAAGAPWEHALYIAGDRGSVRVHLGGIEVTSARRTESHSVTSNSITAELAAFAAAIRRGEPHRNAPEEAVKDVAVVEALMESARTGCSVVPARIP
ncbi:MAG: Gfo/Idh/MocA family oxidoreductase [Anaerolineae bacterium]|nr:Gfo/Idh/MocA family oxidoreductase [Anaerolineae bacterium]